MREGDYPALYTAADGASKRAQRRYVGLTRIELALVLFAAGLSSLRLAVDPNGQVTAMVVAAALAAALAARLANRVWRFNQVWFDGRAVAESAKSAAWRFMMHLDQFSTSDAESRDAFLRRLRELSDERPELTRHLEVERGGDAITTKMERTRALPASKRRDEYLGARVEDQLSWYRDRSLANRKGAGYWFVIGLGAQLLAVLVAITAVGVPPIFSAIGLLSGIAAAATAWAQLGRHDELGRSYALAAQELTLLKSALSLGDPLDSEAVADLIRDAESAISREHTMWVAKRS